MEFKEKLVSFYNLNKLKILIVISILIIFLTSMVFLKANHDKKNLLIGQKYVQAGLYLSSKNIENSIKIYEEIIPLYL